LRLAAQVPQQAENDDAGARKNKNVERFPIEPPADDGNQGNAEEIERGDWFAPAEVTRWINERPEDFASALLLIWRRLPH